MRNVHIHGHDMAANTRRALDEIPEFAETWIYSPADEPELLPVDEIDRSVADVSAALKMLRDAVGLIEARLGSDVGSVHDRIIGAMPVAIVLHHPSADILRNEETLRLLRQITRTGTSVNVGVILVTRMGVLDDPSADLSNIFEQVVLARS